MQSVPTRQPLAAVPALDDVASNPRVLAGLSKSAIASLLMRSAVVQSALTAALATEDAPEQPVSTPANVDVRLLTAKQVAECLEVKESWVMSEARADRIPKHMVGRYVRFDLGEVRRVLEQRQP